MAKLYFSSSGIALWVNENGKDKGILSFLSFWFFFHGELQLFCKFQCALLVVSIYRVLVVYEGVIFFIFTFTF